MWFAHISSPCGLCLTRTATPAVRLESLCTKHKSRISPHSRVFHAVLSTCFSGFRVLFRVSSNSAQGGRGLWELSSSSRALRVVFLPDCFHRGEGSFLGSETLPRSKVSCLAWCCHWIILSAMHGFCGFPPLPLVPAVTIESSVPYSSTSPLSALPCCVVLVLLPASRTEANLRSLVVGRLWGFERTSKERSVQPRVFAFPLTLGSLYERRFCFYLPERRLAFQPPIFSTWSRPDAHRYSPPRKLAPFPSRSRRMARGP